MAINNLIINSFIYLLHSIWLGVFPFFLYLLNDLGILNQYIQLLGSIFAAISSLIALILAVSGIIKHYKLESKRKKLKK